MSRLSRFVPRTAAVLTVGALIAAGGAAPASGTVITHDHFSFSEPGVHEDLCGLAVVRDSTASGTSRIRVDKASGGQAFFLRQNFTYQDVFTNPSNGRTITFEGHSVVNELKATQVEGNVYEFTTLEAGQPFVVRDAAGRVVLRDRGVLRHSVLFDTLGDGEPGGITLDDTIVGVGGPHPGFEQTDEQFCAMIETLLG